MVVRVFPCIYARLSKTYTTPLWNNGKCKLCLITSIATPVKPFKPSPMPSLSTGICHDQSTVVTNKGIGGWSGLRCIVRKC